MGMDLREQLVSIWRRRTRILVIALLVATAVLVLRMQSAPRYAATVTLQIIAPAASTSQLADTVDYQGETVVGLAGTAGLLEDVADRSGLGIDGSEARSRLRVRQDAAPGFLTLTATGPSREAAAGLAAAATDGLTDRLAADRASATRRATQDLRQQLAGLERTLSRMPADAGARTAAEERYAAVAAAITQIESRAAPQLLPPVTPTAAGAHLVGPVPYRDAGLAFVLALILAAEGTVVLRAARGRLPEAEPAAAIQRRLAVPAVVLDRRQDPVTSLVPLYRARLRGRNGVTLLQLLDRRAGDLGPALVSSAALVGDRLRHVDVYADQPTAPDDGPTARSMHPARLDGVALGLIRLQEGPVVIVVDTVSTGMRRLGHELEAIRAVGAEVAAVLVWRGRAPRRFRPRRQQQRAPASTRAGVPRAGGGRPDGRAA